MLCSLPAVEEEHRAIEHDGHRSDIALTRRRSGGRAEEGDAEVLHFWVAGLRGCWVARCCAESRDRAVSGALSNQLLSFSGCRVPRCYAESRDRAVSGAPSNPATQQPSNPEFKQPPPASPSTGPPRHPPSITLPGDEQSSNPAGGRSSGRGRPRTPPWSRF